jgi:hypothetical protein
MFSLIVWSTGFDKKLGERVERDGWGIEIEWDNSDDGGQIVEWGDWGEVDIGSEQVSDLHFPLKSVIPPIFDLKCIVPVTSVIDIVANV